MNGHPGPITYKNISLWKSSSALTSPLVAVETFPSSLETMSSAGRLVRSSLSTQGRSLRKSARQRFIPSCITTQVQACWLIPEMRKLFCYLFISYKDFNTSGLTHRIVGHLLGFLHQNIHPWFQQPFSEGFLELKDTKKRWFTHWCHLLRQHTLIRVWASASWSHFNQHRVYGPQLSNFSFPVTLRIYFKIILTAFKDQHSPAPVTQRFKLHLLQLII